jgi:DNA helicase II / ATP-dependent DNA helicase PcrA
MVTYKPTLEQQRILDHKLNQHARILAGPGTGKSATTVELVGKLLTAKPTLRIKLLTFTRAATAELAEKVSGHPTAAALRPSTIHSFAISVLLANPGSASFPQPLRIADKWEEKNIIYPTLSKRISVRKDRLDNLFREMASNWEYLGPKPNPKVDPAERARFIGSWQEHREIYGYTLLSELPYSLLQALENHSDLKGVDYDLLIVDEYQDLNACDLKVLHLIADQGCSIISAGDDDQSIYSFRNAAPEGIRRFQTDYPGSADYPLSITQRCGRSIIDWASYVIEGDPGRPPRPRLTPAAGSPPGEVAVLAFAGEVSEAEGIAGLVHQLIKSDGVAPKDILILMRGDYRGSFSKPIKAALEKIGVVYADPDSVERLLGEPLNRRVLATFRLLDNPLDSLAWASLLLLTPGISQGFADYIYERARVDRLQFGEALLAARKLSFPDAPVAATAAKADQLINSVLEWVDDHVPPTHMPSEGWGHWIVDNTGGPIVPAPSGDLITLLHDLDDLVEEDLEIGSYLSQITPLGKDLAVTESSGVRIMTMNTSKGLTVRATIIAAAEDGLVPRRDHELSEERMLLFVAMTRAKEFLFATWARTRGGPTLRSGGKVKAATTRERRRPSSFLEAGPIKSQDGNHYLKRRTS